MINSKQMQVRDLSGCYVDDSNVLQGVCNPLKMFFSKRGVTNLGEGSARLTCPVSGIYTEPGAGMTLDGDLILQSATTLDILGSDDTVAAVEAQVGSGVDDDVLLVFSGRPRVANDQFTINVQDTAGGNTSLVSMKNKNAPALLPTVIDAGGVTVSTATMGVTTAGEFYTSFMGIDRSANLECNRNDGSKAGTVIEQTASLATLLSGFVFDDTPQVNFNADIYAMGYFIFPKGLPANYKAMANWMAWNWAFGNYVFPDSWRNIA